MFQASHSSLVGNNAKAISSSSRDIGERSRTSTTNAVSFTDASYTGPVLIDVHSGLVASRNSHWYNEMRLQKQLGILTQTAGVI